jgi:hypothetical protein
MEETENNPNAITIPYTQKLNESGRIDWRSIVCIVKLLVDEVESMLDRD